MQALGDTAAAVAAARTSFDAAARAARGARAVTRRPTPRCARSTPTVAATRTTGAEPTPPADDEAVAARQVVSAQEKAHAALEATTAARQRALEVAEATLARADELTADAECPTCGQPLGETFTQVRSHRAVEVKVAAKELAAADKELAAATKAVATERKTADKAEKALADARAQWQRNAKQRAAAQDARAALRAATEAVVAAESTCDAVRTGLRDESVEAAPRLG